MILFESVSKSPIKKPKIEYLYLFKKKKKWVGFFFKFYHFLFF